MKKAMLVTTTTIAFAVSAVASGATIYQPLNMNQTDRQQLLQIAENSSAQPTAADSAFKNKDPDSIIRNTHDPADDVAKPEPGAQPEPKVNKDPDTIIRYTDTTSPDTVRPQPGAEPEPFQGKDHAGMDKTPRTD